MTDPMTDTNYLPDFKPGTVVLAGAGPGDAGLLTLAAAEALKRADVVIYDALVGDAVMDLIPERAEKIYAGKRGGQPSTKQADIVEKLIEHARAGKRVLRLKGGDPFVFGRGADECLALAEAGIPFRIVPGITAGIAGLTYAGIPATSRETNSAVCFLTGHAATGEVPADIDWSALSEVAPVLVFYMATLHLPEIAERLLRAGRSGDEPVVFISNATTERQKVVETTLGKCADDFASDPLPPPVLVAIGPVVQYRKLLRWFDL
jgi:uroporphyrin-III C-methyltransferase